MFDQLGHDWFFFLFLFLADQVDLPISMPFQAQINRMNEDFREQNEKLKQLKELDLFVLDNSLRESTVGQLRGHTIENKWKIYNEVSQSYVWLFHMITL